MISQHAIPSAAAFSFYAFSVYLIAVNASNIGDKWSLLVFHGSENVIKC